MLLCTASITIKYLAPNEILTFMLKHNINFDIKFSYNALHFLLSPDMFNKTFGIFPNIIITGIHITDNNTIFGDIKIPIMYNKIKYIKCKSKNIMSLSNLEKCVNLQYFKLCARRLIDDENMSCVCTKMRRIRMNVTKSNTFVLERYIINMPKIRYIYIPLDKIIDINNISKLKHLQRVRIWANNKCDGKNFVILVKLLSQLKIKCIEIGNIRCETLANLSSCHYLRRIIIRCCQNLSTIDLNDFSNMKKLCYISIRKCDKLSSITNLKSCRNLQQIKITKCKQIVKFDNDNNYNEYKTRIIISR